MANKRFLDFTTDETPSGASFILVADSVNGVRKTTLENAVAATDVFANINTNVLNLWNNSAAHNSIYRGKDLTAYFNSGEMSAAIADGSFRDIYPGDYIIKDITIDGTTYSNVRFFVMDLDYYLFCGDTPNEVHHVVIMPEVPLFFAAMNSEDVTTGGYVGSEMWTRHIPKVVAGIEAAFGASHVLEHREPLSNYVDVNLQPNVKVYPDWTGASSRAEWVSVKANLATENMVYGGTIMSSSFVDVGVSNSQLAIFRLNHHHINSNRSFWWLQAVAFSSAFCNVTPYGSIGVNAPSSLGGVRPYFLLK